MGVLPPWLIPSWQPISQQLTAGRFGQASMINGDAGVGKLHFAMELAKRLLCQSPGAYACGRCHSCSLFKAHSHSDYFELKPGAGVDEVRALTQWASETPSHGVGKVALLPQVGRLTPNAANALLKALEEPHQHSYFLLLKDTQAEVLPTIVSRCQWIRLSMPDNEQSLSWLKAQYPHYASQLLSTALQLPGTGPMMVDSFLKAGGEERLQKFEQVLDQFRAGDSQPLINLLDKDRETLDWLTQRIIASLRLQRMGRSVSEDPLAGFMPTQLMQTYKGLLELRQALMVTPGLNYSVQLYRAIHPLLSK